MPGLKPALLALLAPAQAGAFVAPGPRSLVSDQIPAVSAAAAAPRARQVASAAESSPAAALGGSALFAGAAVAGALAAAVGRRKRSSRCDGVATVMHIATQRIDPWEGMRKEEPSIVPIHTYQSHVRMRRKARHQPDREQKYRNQRKKLKEAGIWAGYKRFHIWHPDRDSFNLYKGPDSHPDNPDFPAASGGLPLKFWGKDAKWPRDSRPNSPKNAWMKKADTQTQALADAAPASLSAFAAPKSAGVFAGGAAPTCGFMMKKRVACGSFGVTRAQRRGLVLHAHKKAASASKNQGGGSNKKWWGVTQKGLGGARVKVGTLLVKQMGRKVHAGANTKLCRDFRITAKSDGIVQWRGTKNHKEVYVVPWEYVDAKCTWIKSKTMIAPAKYEPWMGNPENTDVRGRKSMRGHVAKLREEWLETEEGKEWAAKKAEKKKKQKEIQAKIRAYRREKRLGQDSEKAKEDVSASGGESESEAES